MDGGQKRVMDKAEDMQQRGRGRVRRKSRGKQKMFGGGGVFYKLSSAPDSRCLEKAQAQMNYSAFGWLISSGTDVRSPPTLEHHLTVNAHWDKQEVLKKDLCT